MVETTLHFAVHTVQNSCSVEHVSISELGHLDPITFSIDLNLDNAQILRVWGDGEICFQRENGVLEYHYFRVDFKPIQGKQDAIYTLRETELLGGKVKFIGKAITRNNFTNHELCFLSSPISFCIRAKQPTGSQIRAFSPCTDLSVLLYKFSNFQLFDENGNPIYNKGYGFKRDHELAVSEIWSWKENLLNCAKEFEDRKQKIADLPRKLRETDLKKYRGLPDFTDEQLKLELWQSYTHTTYHRPVFHNFIFYKAWHWVPNSLNATFSDECSLLEEQIYLGNPPSNWD